AVLNGSCHLLKLGTLLLGSHDIEGHDWQYGSVHGHGDRHLVEGNTVEEHFHVLNRADRNPCLSNITNHTLVIGIVSAVRGQVECHRQSLLARSQVTAIEGI